MAEEKRQRAREQSIALFQQGLQVGFPIVLGYLPIAITYGVLAAQSGMTLLELTMMSVFVFAGASQFMGVNMIAVGASAVEIIVATFVLNFRHFVMSLSFMNEIRDVISLRGRVGLSLGLTDETFTVSSFRLEALKKERPVFFYLAINLSAYASWVAGSFLGGVLGEIIPDQLSQSMGIALYAMFIGLLVPSIKKEVRVALVAIVAIVVNVIASQYVSSGWAIVFGTVLGGLSGVFLLKEKKQ